jgi:hypothetical protein
LSKPALLLLELVRTKTLDTALEVREANQALYWVLVNHHLVI